MTAKEKKAHVWARDPNDWYVEQRPCVEFLLDREFFPGPVLDPACGAGNIVKACMDRGIEAFGSDLVRRTYHTPSWFLGVHDFLSDVELVASSIISNPPYYRAKGAEAFIRKALSMPGCEKVAMIVNAKFLFGEGRSLGLFSEKPPTKVYPVFPRPPMPPGEWLAQGGKAEGGTEDFCWLVWERRAPGSAIYWGSAEVI